MSDYVMDTPLLATIARGIYRPSWVDLDDLIQEGAIGAMLAARRWDPAPGASLRTFCVLRARGAMRDFVRAQDPLSRPDRERQRDIERAKRHLEALGRPTSSADIADYLDEDVTNVERWEILLRRGRESVELNTALDGSTDSHLDDSLIASESGELVNAMLDRLPPRSRDVVESFYMREELQRDIAARLGVTEARVSQILAEARELIRTRVPKGYLQRVLDGFEEAA